MEAFAILKKNCTHKGLVKLSDLPRGEYLVSEFSLMQTRYGPKLKLDLGDMYVILPSSSAVGLTAESTATLNTVPQIFIWGGYGETQFEP